jgi:hypothetical protein
MTLRRTGVPSVRTMFAAEGVDAMLGKVADSQAVL